MDTITEPTPASTASSATPETDTSPSPSTPRSLPRSRHLDQPEGGRRRRRRWFALVALGLAAVAVVASPDADGPMTHTPSPLLDPDVRGVYRFASGEELTLLGTQARPRYEMGAMVVELFEDSPDSFRARDDTSDRIELQRSNESVTGLVHHRSDGSAAVGERTETFAEHDVGFASPGAELAGTLFLPKTPGPHPAVVIVHGAERATRETYRLLATHYARRGIAALIYDKRGLGSSTGDVATASFDDLTADALAGAEMLRSRREIDPRRVGVAGFSQGGWLAAFAADRDPEIAFVIAYSASGFSPADQNAWLYGNLLATRGFDAHTIGVADRMVRMLYSTVDLVDAGVMPAIPQVPGFWFHALDLHLETAELWERIDRPVLGIWGADDCQVPSHDSARAIAGALERGGNSNHKLMVLAGADHGLTVAGPCEHELGLRHHDRMRHAPEYLHEGAAWIHQHDDDSADTSVMIQDPGNPDLAWHQQPPSPAPWYMTAAVQIPTMLLLPVGFGIVAVAELVQRRRRCDSIEADRTMARTRLSRTRLCVLVSGVTTVLAGAVALVEVATLGDLYSRLLVGDSPVGGTTPLLLAAGLVATATTVVTAVLAARIIASHRPKGSGAATKLDWAVVALGTATVLWAWSWQLPLVTLSSVG